MGSERKNWRHFVTSKRPPRVRKQSICVFTEGETESLYFSSFELRTLRVKCFGLGGGNACHLVKEAKAQKSTSQFSDFDQYWIVFDCDDNSESELQNAIRLAENSRFKWCFSNPCFEIWILLHYVYRDSPTTAQELKHNLLPKYIPNYKETLPGVKQLLEPYQHIALRNAERLNPLDTRNKWKQRLRYANPSTNIDELVCLLNKFAEQYGVL